MNAVMLALRNSPELQQEIGQNIKINFFKPVSGKVQLHHGIFDVKFEISGSKSKAKVEIKLKRMGKKWESEKIQIQTQKTFMGCFRKNRLIL